jgi:hypothetical protein
VASAAVDSCSVERRQKRDFVLRLCVGGRAQALTGRLSVWPIWMLAPWGVQRERSDFV